MPDSSILIRPAVRDDAPALLALVDALADYEHLPPPDAAARQRLIRDCLGERPRIHALLAFAGDRPAGYAFHFETYSSFLALPTLYLEDLFVLSEFRGMKIGYRLFMTLVEEAWRRGCGRMEWTVLDWNSLARDFYKSLKARHMKEWELHRLIRDDMEELLGGRPPGGG